MANDIRTREDWLNGWTRQDRIVLIGTGVHCAGCGLFEGIATVAFSDEWVAPEQDPAWPFDEERCPVHLQFRYGPDEVWPRGKPRPLP